MTSNISLAAPSRGGYENKEHEKTFKMVDPDGRTYLDYEKIELDPKNDYYKSITRKKYLTIGGKQIPITDAILPKAKFKMEIIRNGKVSCR